MLSTAGIPEVPPVPVGQVWGRETGQWVAISQTGGTFLPIAGGSMQGNINMQGNTVTNMAAVPAMPNGAAPAQWVLNQIASVSLYQGTWNADTNVPDLTQLSTHVNAYTWIALTTAPAGVVIGAAIPGLQGTTVFNGDTIIYSTVEGQFKAIHGGGITLPEADGRYVQLAGSQMSGALLLNANASQPLQAVTLQQLQAAEAGMVTPDAPADGQAYLRVGVGTNRWVPGLPLAGGILTGALTLSGNAAQPLNAVPLQQVQSLITAGTTGFLPLAGGVAMTGQYTLSGNATANLNPVPLQQINAMLATYAPLQNPAFSGSPTSTTPPTNDNSTRIATTAFIAGQAATALPLMDGTPPVIGTSLLYARQDHVHPSDTSRATTAQLAGYLPLAGGTINPGPLSIATGGGTSTFATSGSLNLPNSPTVTAPGISAQFSAFGTTNILTPNLPLTAVSNTGTTAQMATWAPSGASALVVATSQTTNSLVTFAFYTGTLTTVGNINTNGSSVSYNTTSDDRLKTNQAAITNAGALIDQLQPITFNWSTDATGAAPTHGFSAQATASVYPDAVTQGLGNPGDENFRPWGMDSSKMVPLLVAAVQALRSRVAALESHAGVSPAVPVTA